MLTSQGAMAITPHMTDPSDTLTFEAIVDRLDSIAERLESGEAQLEEALQLFEEGVRLSKVGTRRLDEAERKLEILLDNDETAPFDPERGADG